MNDGIKMVATNRKAKRDYFVDDTYEGGLVLTGSEIKSVRAGRVNLRDGFVREMGGELWMVNVHIATYAQAGVHNHDPLRSRKVLLHRREIDRLLDAVQMKGYTIIPMSLYLRRGRAKVEIALAKGKRKYDKRQAIAKRDAERQIQRALSERLKG